MRVPAVDIDSVTVYTMTDWLPTWRLGRWYYYWLNTGVGGSGLYTFQHCVGPAVGLLHLLDRRHCVWVFVLDCSRLFGDYLDFRTT